MKKTQDNQEAKEKNKCLACQEKYMDMLMATENFCESCDTEHGGMLEAYAYLVGKECFELSECEDAYQGKYDSDKDFTKELFESGYGFDDIPSHVWNYIDWDKMSYDYMMDYSQHNGYYFRNT